METVDVTRSVRLRRAAALLPAAAVYALLVPDTLRFYWTPFLLGVAYLAAAIAGGRRGGMWGTALVLLGWGGAVLAVSQYKFDIGTGNAYLIGLGAAALVAGALAQRGFSVDLVSIGGTAMLSGVVHRLAQDVDAFVKPWPYIVLLVAVGVVNLGAALAGRRVRGAAHEPVPG